MSKLIHYSGPAGSILLPQGYTRLAYIESTGTQWVNTGWKTTNKTEIYTEMYVDGNSCGTTAFPTLFGARNEFTYFNGNGNSQSITIRIWDYKGNYSYDFPFNRWNSIHKTPTQCWVNAQERTNYTLSSFTHTQPTYIFANNSNGSVEYQAAIRCKFFRIWDDGNIKRDFVPVQTTAIVTSADGTSCPSGSIGLLDLVENKFYQNKGTGTFIAGPEIPQGFPTSEYCQVEWLESTGKQKLQITGLTAAANDQFGINVMVANTTENKNKSFTVKSGSNQFYTGGHSYDATNKTIMNFSSVGGATRYGGWIIPYGLFVQAELSTTTCGTETLNRPLTDNVTTLTIMENSSCRIAYFKVSHKNAVVRHLIPCYRRSDMKPGMYDLISRTFLTNQGTGEFLLGPSITFGWGEVVNNVGAEAHPMFGTQYTETNKFTYTDNRKDSFKTLPVYQRVEPGQQISISFDTDVTQWASHHDVSGGTTNKGKWTMWIYFSKVYNPNRYNPDSGTCYAASQIKSLGGTRWKYSFTVPAGMHMIRVRTNLYSDGSTSYTAHFWNFNWSFGDTGCQVNPLHAIPHNISTGDGKFRINTAFDFFSTNAYLNTDGQTTGKTYMGWFYTASKPAKEVFFADSSSGMAFGITNNGKEAIISTENAFNKIFTLSTWNTGWNHIAVVKADNGPQLYINGIAQTATSRTNGWTHSGGLWIGARSTFNNNFSGRCQDFKVFDTAFTQAQIQQEM